MINKQEIKNLIFDLGGVLLDLSPQKSIEAFKTLGLEGVIGEGGWSYHHPVFLNMEQGLLSDEAFRDGIRELLPEPKTDDEINAAWCAMLVDFPAEKIELLQALKKHFTLFLFSNTNSIHLNHFRGLFRQKFSFELDDLFTKTFYSHEMGARKPLAESYLQLLDGAKIKAHESLFIDDSEANTEGANKLGIQTIHFDGTKSLHELFKGYY